MPRHPKKWWEQHFGLGSKLGNRGLKACSMRKQSAQGRSVGWRSKQGQVSLLTLSWKVDEDICNGACYGKPMGNKFSSKTLSQLERYVLHNEVLQMTLHWNPCSYFQSLSLSFCPCSETRSRSKKYMLPVKDLCVQFRSLESRSAKAPNDSPVAGGAWQQKVCFVNSRRFTVFKGSQAGNDGPPCWAGLCSQEELKTDLRSVLLFLV